MRCIDAVGLEAHGTSRSMLLYDRAKTGADASRPIGRMRCARRFMACRKGGTVSIPGVYGGFLDKFPLARRSPRA